MRDFIAERWTHILADSWQHLSLVVQCLILATIIGVVCAALSYKGCNKNGVYIFHFLSI